MDSEEIKKVLKAVGIGSGVILVLITAGLGIYAYRSYLEIQLLNLEIKQLREDEVKK